MNEFTIIIDRYQNGNSLPELITIFTSFKPGSFSVVKTKANFNETKKKHDVFSFFSFDHLISEIIDK